MSNALTDTSEVIQSPSTETCPNCGSGLGIGVMAEYAKTPHPEGAICPECPEARRRAPGDRKPVAEGAVQHPGSHSGKTAAQPLAPKARRKDRAAVPARAGRKRGATNAASGTRKAGTRRTTGTASAHPGATPADGALAGAGARSEAASEKLRPGQLNDLVLKFMSDHRGEDFTPTQVSKALDGKSSGAILNCLAKHAAKGGLSQTSEKPKRFRMEAA
jgi:hypothetical protein